MTVIIRIAKSEVCYSFSKIEHIDNMGPSQAVQASAFFENIITHIYVSGNNKTRKNLRKFHVNSTSFWENNVLFVHITVSFPGEL